MLGHRTIILICLLGIPTSYSSLDVVKTGWLDRVVSYLKESFLNDAAEVAPIKLETSIATAPPGYEDSSDWDQTSVMRLLKLLSQSNPPKPVRRMLRQVAKDLSTETRRMSLKQSFKVFPSMRHEFVNDLYYDSDYTEESTVSSERDTSICNDTLLFIRNPLEARLPSGAISVALLKNIMFERALKARSLNMATTEKQLPTFRTLFPKKGATTEGNQNDKKDNETSTDGATTAGDKADTSPTDAEGGNGTNGDGTSDAAEGEATTEAPAE